MHQTRQYQIKKKHKMYAYFEELSLLANNLANTTIFYLRQYATAKYAFEEMKPLHEHQMEIFNLVEGTTRDTKYHPKENVKWLNYNQLDFIFKETKNVDYFALPMQCNQQIIKMVLRDFKSYFESLKAYQNNPKAFTGKPKMPKYKKSGGKCTVILTNQICKIKEDKYLKFPKTKMKLNLAKFGLSGTLKEVRIKPHFEGFTVDAVLEEAYEDEISSTDNAKLLTKYKDYTSLTERALAIDTGLSNLCAIVNNFGDKPLLINGNPIKSKNQYYNKCLSKARSDAKKHNNLDWTLRMERLTRKRNNQIKDYMHKTSTYIANYAKSQDVKIVIIGHNKLQKKDINIGKVNNQNFVMIPMLMLINQLKYKLNRLGIELITVEESYTSLASFENMDFLPTYGKDDKDAIFTGVRIKRGLYQSNGKKSINADLNGAANILRKVFPNINEWDSGIVNMPITKITIKA